MTVKKRIGYTIGLLLSCFMSYGLIAIDRNVPSDEREMFAEK